MPAMKLKEGLPAPDPMDTILAGCFAGGLEALLMWPNEVIKTELQMQSKANPKYKGVIDCAKQKIATGGVMSLYRGLVPIVIGSMPKAGIRFGGFEFFSNQLKDENGKVTSSKRLLAGLSAGACEAVFAVTPMETLKVKLINQNKPFVSGTLELLRKEGFSGIYQGVVPTVAKQSLNQGTRFLVAGEVNIKLKEMLKTDVLSTPMAALGGMIGGTASVLVNQPLDTIKTRMQSTDAKALYKGSMDCAMQTVKQDGWFALYKGLVPRLGRVVPGQAVIFGSYNFISNAVVSYRHTGQIDW